MSRSWDPFAPTPTPTLTAQATAGQATAGPPAPEPPGDDLDGLSKARLVDRAERAGLSTSGTKPELIERLRER